MQTVWAVIFGMVTGNTVILLLNMSRVEDRMVRLYMRFLALDIVGLLILVVLLWYGVAR